MFGRVKPSFKPPLYVERSKDSLDSLCKSMCGMRIRLWSGIDSGSKSLTVHIIPVLLRYHESIYPLGYLGLRLIKFVKNMSASISSVVLKFHLRASVGLLINSRIISDLLALYG
jgi:hypothetical protein